jgi:hypothetical protein
MKNQELGAEGLGKMEGVGKGPMGVFREIGTEKNLFEHDSAPPFEISGKIQKSLITPLPAGGQGSSNDYTD